MHFRNTTDVLTLRLHLLEMMTILSRHYQQVSNPVLRHHIQVTFYHLQKDYQESESTPVSFKSVKRSVLNTIDAFLLKADKLDTKTEYMPAIRGNKNTDFRAVA
ncbi:hypothetical protein FLA_5344 [Filimonas lacunae]|nr:hypothetical protein FLA_5344 [Filimonas lacunae]